MAEISFTNVVEKLLEKIRSEDGRKIKDLVRVVIDELVWTSTVARTEIRKAINVLALAGIVTIDSGYGERVYLKRAGPGEAAAVQEALDAMSARASTYKQERDTALESLKKALALADEAKAELQKAGPKEIVLKVGDGKAKKLKGQHHAAFEKVLRLCAARKNVLLIGPAGTGKTHLAEQVAEALSLPFSHISCSAGMSEGQLTGRLLPTGKQGQFEYVTSQFVHAYENGGVFLFDELDAADSNTMLVLNSALANGSMALSNRPEAPVAKKHKDFVCLAAANTYGTGADRQYVGRNQMDESTLDRFRIGQVEMDYDANTEKVLCPDEALRTRLLGYRAKVRQAKLRRVVSMRFMADAYQMKQSGFTDADIDGALFCGWTPDEIAKVKGTF